MDYLIDLLQSGLIDARCKTLATGKKGEMYADMYSIIESASSMDRFSPEKKYHDTIVKDYLDGIYGVGFSDGTELTGNKVEKADTYKNSAAFQLLTERCELEIIKEKGEKPMDYQVLSEMLAYLAGFIDAVSTLIQIKHSKEKEEKGEQLWEK